MADPPGFNVAVNAATDLPRRRAGLRLRRGGAAVDAHRPPAGGLQDG